MSHTTQLKSIKFVDMAALADAVQYLADQGVKISLEKNTKPRMYYRTQEYVVDYVVKLPNSQYDIGFEKQADGSYYPIYDAWAGSIRSQVGAPKGVVGQDIEEQKSLDISKLIDLYGIHAAKNQLESQGYGYNTEISYNSEDDSYTLEVNSGY